MAQQAAVRPQAVPIDLPYDEATVSTRRFSFSKLIGRVFFWLLIVIIMIYTLFPFYWAIVSSISPDAALFNTPAQH